MFSALKKITGRNSTSPGGSAQNGVCESNGVVVGSQCHSIASMPASLQKKFSRGVHYNMKLLLRGDIATGKTTLFKRLQGEKFNEEYVQSDEIQVSAIQWNHKATDDIVKVDVWDVVDKGKKRIKLEGLKIAETDSSGPGSLPGAGGSDASLDACLDAEFLDVYQGAHGVIFLFDVTKQWTFDYVTREVPRVPEHIPVLVLANFIDKSHHRAVTRDQAVGFIEHLEGREASNVRYAESSMRNGFGLRFLHKFLSLPYLTLQRQSLVQQLERNEHEMRATSMELDLYLQSEDSDYERFSKGLTEKRRQEAEKAAPKPTVDVVVGQQSNTVPSEKGTRYSFFHYFSFQLPMRSFSAQATAASFPTSPRTVMSPAPMLKIPESSKPGASSSSTSNIVEAEKAAAVAAISAAAAVTANGSKGSPSKGGGGGGGDNSVDNFVPDSGEIDFFLDDTSESRSNANPAVGGAHGADGDDTSDDEDGGNPMVAKFQEDIDDDDEGGPSPVAKGDYDAL